VESARADLANALGVKVSASISVLHPVIPQNVSDVDRAIDVIMAEVVRTRPDAAAAYANVRARGYVVHSARARIWLELVIGGSANKKSVLIHPGRLTVLTYLPASRGKESTDLITFTLSWR
jgi:outer membrane protein TolC